MSDFEPGEIKIEGRVMDHARGVWAGMRPHWFTATHIPTGFAVTWHEHCDSGRGQHRQREAALACLRLMIDEMRPAELPKVHPNDQGNRCNCSTCWPDYPYFRACPDCGNKRCPKSKHHDHACTRSNEPGQVGSNYEQ